MGFFGLLFVALATIRKGLETTRQDIAQLIKLDLQSARRVVLSLDCWSKKGLTAAFLGIPVAFFNPKSCQPQHVLLKLHQTAHPHIGLMLAENIKQTMTEWSIESNKILMAVTDNGYNMIKAIASVKLEGGTRQRDTESESDSDIDEYDGSVGDPVGPNHEEVGEDKQQSDEDDDDVSIHYSRICYHS